MPEEQESIGKPRAILSADVKDYSLLMVDDESRAIQKLKEYRTRMSNLIQANSGRVVNVVEDNLLAEFSSAEDAVQCAVEIQNALKAKNAELAVNNRLNFGIGINVGHAVQAGEGIVGGGVDVAAHIQEMTGPGGVNISRSTYDQIKDKLTYGYRDLGEHEVENTGAPVRVYSVLMAPRDAGRFIGESSRTFGQKMFMWAVAALIAMGVGVAVWFH